MILHVKDANRYYLQRQSKYEKSFSQLKRIQDAKIRQYNATKAIRRS